jgi:hypothetical protein
MAFEVVGHVFGGVTWVAIRNRGGDWLWFQPNEAADLGHVLIAAFGDTTIDPVSVLDTAPAVTGSGKAIHPKVAA